MLKDAIAGIGMQNKVRHLVRTPPLLNAQQPIGILSVNFQRNRLHSIVIEVHQQDRLSDVKSFGSRLPKSQFRSTHKLSIFLFPNPLEPRQLNL